jgi:hypothetical protein
MIRPKKVKNASPAQALVEFALIATLLLTLIFIVIEGARYLWAWNSVQNASREAARYAITGSDENFCLTETHPRYNFLCDTETPFRVSAVFDVAHTAMSGLPLDEEHSIFDVERYVGDEPIWFDNSYEVFIYGTRDDAPGFQEYFAGGPGQWVNVSVYYRMPLIVPLLGETRSTLAIKGSTTLLNEPFGQLANAEQSVGLPPDIPPVPTAGPTPSPTPSPSTTPTNTPGPTPTATETPTITPTDEPEICPVRFEGNAIAGNTYLFITGEVGSTVTIIDVDTGVTLGTAKLIARNGHFCEGFADFQPSEFSPLIEALTEGHLLVATSSDGSFDETFVIGQSPTGSPTPTSTKTPIPTPSSTPTATPTHTPSQPYIILNPTCASGPDVQFVVLGFNWPLGEDINLFWNTSQYQLTVNKNQHNGAFSRVLTITGLANATYSVVAISTNLTTASTNFKVPCAVPPTPTPSTATPTSTPRPADLVMISPPKLLSVPPITAYQPVDFSVIITNTGEVDVNTQFFVDLYFDPTNVFTSYIPITESVGFSAVSGLPSGASRVITITAPIGFKNVPNPHLAYGMVDSVNVPGGQIPEPIENNNVSNPAQIAGVIPANTPTPTPTFDPSGSDFIAGIVQSRVGSQWVPQGRATVALVNSMSNIIAITEADLNGYYIFNNVSADTYSIFSCIDINGVDYFGLRTGIVPPNPAANVYMLPSPCTINPPTNNLPIVTNPGNQVNDVGDVVSVAIVATDSDGPSSLTYSSTGLPPGLTINPTTGLITGTLPPTSQGIYNVTINVYDGQGTTSIFFTWTVIGLKLETVTMNSVNSSSWTTVNLSNTYDSMVAVCTVVYANNSIPEVVRMRNAAGSSFQIKLQNPSNSLLASEKVHCIVMEEGVWKMNGRSIEGRKYTSTVTDSKSSWNGQARTYGQSYTNPVVLGQVMTTNDPDWSTFWTRGNSRTSPPNSTTLFTGKHVGEDGDTTRSNETIGYIVIEQGNGTADGIAYEANLGPDIVQGVDNGLYTYNFVSAFSSSPAGAVLTMAGMDGNDGGWAILRTANPFTAATMKLSADEDTISDSERVHSTEQVGYFVFQSQIVLDGTE